MLVQQQTQSSYIPQEAYLYFPQANDVKTHYGERIIFDGNTQFDASENAKIMEFRNYAARNYYSLPPMWTDGMIMRFLYSSRFRMDITLSNVKAHTYWRQTCLPVQLDSRIQQSLNSGIVYVCGRDNQFHPIVVLNMSLLASRNFDDATVLKFLTFWFEIILQEYMLPGQIENWIFIIDLSGMRISKSTTHTMKQVMASLEQNYKCRLHSLYMVNASSSVYLPWKMFKNTLDHETLNKINFYKHPVPEALFINTNPNQVEQKYGGSTPNFRRFWPLQANMNSVPLTRNTQAKIVSVDTYRNLYKQGLLSNMKVNPQFIQEGPTVQETNNEPAVNSVVPIEANYVERQPMIQQTGYEPAFSTDAPLGMAFIQGQPVIQQASYDLSAFNTAMPLEVVKRSEIELTDGHADADEHTREENDNFIDFADYSEDIDNEEDYTEYMNEAIADSQYATKTKVFDTSFLEVCE